MIVTCLEDGLTVGNRVYYKGDCFKLAQITQQEFGEMSEEQSARRQKRIYGKVYFRKATVEEILDAHAARKITGEMLDAKEARLIHEFRQSEPPPSEEEDIISDEFKKKFAAEDKAKADMREKLLKASKKVEEDEKTVKSEKPAVKRKTAAKKSIKKKVEAPVEEEEEKSDE